MQKITKILCVGDNSADTDRQCRQYAEQYQVKYQGLLVNDNINYGCYHTSIMDSSIKFIKSIYDKFDKVIFLKQNNTKIDILSNLYSKNSDLRTEISNTDILFVGCSHTYGSGHNSRDTVYTHQFSKMIGVNPLVNGYPGRGNFLIEDMLSTYKLTNKKVIIQFTDIFRIRYFSVTEDTVIHKQGSEFTINEVKMFDDARLQYEYLKIVDRVVSRLRDAGCEFLFFQLTPHRGKLQEDIDLYQSQYREFCYMADMNVDVAEDNIHYGSLSHQLIAEELNKKWCKLYAENS